MAGFTNKRIRINDAENEEQVSTKARRQCVRGRKGSLQDMPQMPLDTLFEGCTLSIIMISYGAHR